MAQFSLYECMRAINSSSKLKPYNFANFSSFDLEIIINVKDIDDDLVKIRQHNVLNCDAYAYQNDISKFSSFGTIKK